MADALRVLMITSEWPTPENPSLVPFIVQQTDFLRQAGIEVDVFSFRGGKQLAKYFHAWRNAQKKIANGRYHLVHAQWGQSGLLALPKRIPLVVTFRGDDLEGIIGQNGRQTRQGLLLKQISRTVARAADQVIFVSESLSRTVPRNNYHIIPSGVNLQLFCPIPPAVARKKLGLSQDRQYVLFVGAAANPRKRFYLAKHAVEILRPEMDIELLVADHLRHEQIPDYMNASDVLLLTSIHEGSPNVVKEALACNLPVISTDVGDVKQRIAGIPENIILESDRPETIANALRKTLQRRRRANSRHMVEPLDENLLTQKVIDVYRLALRNS